MPYLESVVVEANGLDQQLSSIGRGKLYIDLVQNLAWTGLKALCVGHSLARHYIYGLMKVLKK